MKEPSVVLLVTFVKRIACLALPAGEQIEYLRHLEVSPLADELALEFSEGFDLLPQFVAQGWLSAADVEVIERLDALLSSMSGLRRHALWTEEGLTNASEWERVRQEARSFLTGMRS